MKDVIATEQQDPFEGLEDFIVDNDESTDNIPQEDLNTFQNSQELSPEENVSAEPDMSQETEDIAQSNDGFQKLTKESKLGKILTDITGHTMGAVWHLNSQEESEYLEHIHNIVDPILGFLAIDDVLGGLPIKNLNPTIRLMIAVGFIILIAFLFRPHKSGKTNTPPTQNVNANSIGGQKTW